MNKKLSKLIEPLSLKPILVTNAFQWLQFVSSATVISKYYGVSEDIITWTSTVTMINFVVLILPATYMIENLTSRTILLIGCLLNTGEYRNPIII